MLMYWCELSHAITSAAWTVTASEQWARVPSLAVSKVSEHGCFRSPSARMLYAHGNARTELPSARGITCLHAALLPCWHPVYLCKICCQGPERLPPHKHTCR